jgi:hypothetical protein
LAFRSTTMTHFWRGCWMNKQHNQFNVNNASKYCLWELGLRNKQVSCKWVVCGCLATGDLVKFHFSHYPSVFEVWIEIPPCSGQVRMYGALTTIC